MIIFTSSISNAEFMVEYRVISPEQFDVNEDFSRGKAIGPDTEGVAYEIFSRPIHNKGVKWKWKGSIVVKKGFTKLDPKAKFMQDFHIDGSYEVADSEIDRSKQAEDLDNQSKTTFKWM